MSAFAISNLDPEHRLLAHDAVSSRCNGGQPPPSLLTNRYFA
jgi:hypothetical protein